MMRILLVDDSRVTREVTKVFLVSNTIKVLEARNGEDALRLIKEERPDVVVADLQMPRLDGVGLCSAIGADPLLGDIPVIILTSKSDAATRQRCLSAGAREVLTKPVQPQDLLACIQRNTAAAHPERLRRPLGGDVALDAGQQLLRLDGLDKDRRREPERYREPCLYVSLQLHVRRLFRCRYLFDEKAIGLFHLAPSHSWILAIPKNGFFERRRLNSKRPQGPDIANRILSVAVVEYGRDSS